MERSEILEHLIRSADWTASRSSGPGGQHRDKASTRAELTLTRESLAGLESETASAIATKLDLDERPLRIVVQDERSLSRNREIAIERLAELIMVFRGTLRRRCASTAVIADLHETSAG